MIFKHNFMRNEMQKTYLFGKNNKVKLIVICLLLALFSLVINNLFVLMQESIIAEIMPQFVKKSFQSVINLHNTVILFFFIFYYAEKYKNLTYVEISRNKWYFLQHLGYKPAILLTFKNLSNFMLTLAIYSLSYISIFVLSIIFNYSVTPSVMFSLAFTGLVKSFFIVSCIMFVSIFTKKASYSVTFSLISLFFMTMLSIITGFDNATSNVSIMKNITKLFALNAKWFLIILISVGILLAIVTNFIAYFKMKKYYPVDIDSEEIYYEKNNDIELKTNSSQRYQKIAKRIAYGFITAIMGLVILTNISLILLGSQSQNKEFEIFGYTPLAFKSETMKGYIEKNDLAIFKTPPANIAYAKNMVILYRDKGETNVRVIKETLADGYILVDIANYPVGSETGSMSQLIHIDDISATLVFTNRWLGAWFMFNDSLPGKVISLAIPLLILCFYDKIIILLKLTVKELDSEY